MMLTFLDRAAPKERDLPALSSFTPVHFCTYFDRNYLRRGLALYRSLVDHAKPFRLWVLCFDDPVFDVLHQLDLPELIPISLRDFEKRHPEFLETKSSRSRIEYYFTSTPSLILDILESNPEVEAITYLDADLFFFSDPSSVYEELKEGSVLIVEHRFPPRLAERVIYGIYNVGFLAFRGDETGMECLHWWRDRCLEWCYDRLEAGRFADQKYLDDWPTRFPGVVVLQHKGGGLAPWNISNASLRIVEGRVLVDSDPLMFFHFHNSAQMSRWLFDPGLREYGVTVDPLIKHEIYGPYLRALHEASQCVSHWGSQSSIRVDQLAAKRRATGQARPPAATCIRQQLSVMRRVLHGDIWVTIGGRIL